MAIPADILSSSLWAKIGSDSRLVAVIDSLRTSTEQLAHTIARDVPGFTDHSVIHMDALWGIAAIILTPEEIEELTVGEAFLLGVGFYLHDIGMAYAATPEGLKHVREQPSYQGQFKLTENDAEAIAFTVRKIHAEAALKLALEKVPGTDYFLLEPASVREQWGTICGKIAASHHWDIEQLDEELSTSSVPLPDGLRGDLGYVAAILRLVDYAHINCERANPLSKAFKHKISDESLLHWQAQEKINGPLRESNSLKYRTAKPISNVKAWWLFYWMMKGLDAEIRLVQRYLNRRVASKNRFSLQGVIGAESPEDAATYIQSDGFLPIEVHLRTGSIDRLVQILAGESLYGNDPMAAVRELIQNARDAAVLKKIISIDAAEQAVAALPIEICLMTNTNPATLFVRDYGVGMDKKIITNSLLTVASDYWDNQFHLDYPNVLPSKFKPAGKFGIGFLSVFMLGERVTVTSTKKSCPTYQLTLSGMGAQGELRELQLMPASGTKIDIELKHERLKALQCLPDKVRNCAPMLAHPIKVNVDGEETDIPVDWIFKLSANNFYSWVNNFNGVKGVGVGYRGRLIYYSSEMSLKLPSDIWPVKIPEYTADGVRLVASNLGCSILCLRGIAIQVISTPGFAGAINSDSVVPDAARKIALEFDVENVLQLAKEAIIDDVIDNLNSFNNGGVFINKLPQLSMCVELYGSKCLEKSELKWLSLINKSGEIDLVSVRQLIELMTTQKSIYVGYGSNPWNILKEWGRLDCKKQGEINYAICFDDSDGRLEYLSSHEHKFGKLIDVTSNIEGLNLFNVAVDAIAVAWTSDKNSLLHQKGWAHRGHEILGVFTKNT